MNLLDPPFAGKLKKAALVCLLFVPLTTGCVYTHIQRPLGTEYFQTDLGTKVGRSSSYALFYLFAWGDAGSKAAADNGNIKIIKHADIEIHSYIFGLYMRVSTVVYGD
jgi:hypothetical protein